MGHVFRLILLLRHQKALVFGGVIFQFLSAIFTLISIPLVIPFFQILFGISPTSFDPPTGIADLEGTLNYYFSRLIVISDRPTALAVVCWAVVIVFMFRNVFRYLSAYCLVAPVNGVIRDVRNSLFDAFTRMSVAQRYNHKKGHLLSLMSNDISEIDHGIMKAVELLFKAPLVLLGSLVFMIWISPMLSVVAVALIVVVAVVIGTINRTLKAHSFKALESLDRLHTASEEYLQGKKVMDAYGAADFFTHRFETANDLHYRQVNRILRKRDLSSPVTEFLAIGIVVILLWYGSNLVFRSAIQPATFFAFIFAFYQIIEPAKSFSRELANVYKASAALDRIRNLTSGLGQKIQTGTEGKEAMIPDFKEYIHFDKVSFLHREMPEPLFDKLELTIPKGQHLGIVGLSGAGKTTLVDLLFRFYSPNSGQIVMDGRPVAQYKEPEYRKLFGLVSQEAVLFHGSLKDNILLGRNWNTERFEEAVDLADCRQFMADRILDANTTIGDQGVLLSGGERQRITLARAVYDRPEIIVLDEPTSALDPKSEFLVRQAIFKAMKKRTAIMISHNVHLLRDMDRIIVLDRGAVVQDGTYDELSVSAGLFRELLAFQQRNIFD